MLLLILSAYANCAGQSFRLPPFILLPTSPQKMVSGDFNGDHLNDLVLLSGTDLRILISNGNGTYQEAVDYLLTSRSTEMGAADVNGDGKLDLILLSGNTQTLIVSAWLGNGDGTFKPPINSVASPPSSSASYPNGSGIGAGDFNGDGKIDLLAADDVNNTVNLLLGDGTGNFKLDQSTFASYPTGFLVADFNHDASLDFAVVSSLSAQVTVYLENGKGPFSSPSLYNLSAGLSGVRLADLNGDGKIDIVAPSFEVMQFLLNDGTGHFAVTSMALDIRGSGGTVSADLNGDGKADIALTDTNGVEVYYGDGTGGLLGHDRYLVGSGPAGLVLDDINQDNIADLVVANTGGSSLSFLFGTASGKFNPQVPTADTGFNPSDFAVADLNGDGIPDLVVGIGTSGSALNVVTALGNGDGTFRAPMVFPPSQLSSGSYAAFVAAADLNGDDKADVVASTSVPYIGFSVFLGNGDGTVQAPQNYPAGEGGVIIADFDNDAIPDLINGETFWKGVGDGTFTSGPCCASGTIVDDFNHDGKLDLAGVSQSYQMLFVSSGNGDGTFQPAVTYPLPAYPIGLTAADFDGDGKTDLIVTYGFQSSYSFLKGNPDGTFQDPVTTSIFEPQSYVTAADLNGDGKQDLIFSDSGTPYFAAAYFLSVAMGNGDGTFQPLIRYPAGNIPGAVKAIDMNGDGAPDLVLSNFESTAIAVILNNGGTFIQAPGSPNPALVGTSVTFSATVSASVAGNPMPTGSITFKDGAAVLGTFPLNAGQASFSTSSLIAGKHSISANYSGDGFFNPHSVTIEETILGLPTSTALNLSATATTFGQPVTLTATVTSAYSGVPTGAVQFMDGATVLASVPLNGSAQAQFTTTSLAAESHVISGVYVGDSRFAGSSSAAVSVEVGGLAFDLTLSHSPGIPLFGTSIVFTAQAVNQSGAAVSNIELQAQFSELKGASAQFVIEPTNTSGTCTISGLLVTCALGAMNNSDVALVTIDIPPGSFHFITATASLNASTTSASDSARFRFRPFRF